MGFLKMYTSLKRVLALKSCLVTKIVKTVFSVYELQACATQFG